MTAIHESASMRRERRRVAAITVCIVLFPAAAPALLGNTQGPFGIDGTFRTTVFGLRNYDNPQVFGPDNPSDVLLQSSLRLMAAGHATDWLSFQIHALQELRYTTIPQVPGQPPPLQVPVRRYRVFCDRWYWVNDTDTTASLSPEWYNVKLNAEWGDVIVGRQPITLGKAYLWNPLDIFSPFDPQQFDRDYKPGVDTVRLSVPLGNFSAVELISALGREITSPTTYETAGRAGIDWYGSAILGRAYTTLSGFDFSAQGGKVYGGVMAGGGVVGEVGLGVQIRGEAAHTWALDDRPLPPPLVGDFVKDSLQAVLSAGRRWQSSLDAEAEYYFNGAGEGRSNLAAGRLRQITGGTQQWGKHFVGTTASYEFLPILVGRIVGILSLTDDSGFVQAFGTWSLSNESDLIFGGIVNLGERPTCPTDQSLPVVLRSEFGTYPDALFVQFKTFF